MSDFNYTATEIADKQYELANRKRKVDQWQREERSKLAIEIDEEAWRRRKEIMNECEQIGHIYEFKGCTIGRDACYVCSVCGHSKVDWVDH